MDLCVLVWASPAGPPRTGSYRLDVTGCWVTPPWYDVGAAAPVIGRWLGGVIRPHHPSYVSV